MVHLIKTVKDNSIYCGGKLLYGLSLAKMTITL